MISFLLPTRNRSDKLKTLLDSFIKTASSIDNYEVILVFDDDDVEHIKQFESIPKNFNYKKIVMKRVGYNNLQEYYNTAALNSSGDWLWVWNDDSKMLSKDWDLIIEEYTNKFVIINPWNTRPEDSEYLQTNSLFPIVPRKMVELLGYFSPWNHIDTYWNRLQNGLSLLKNEFRIVHTHEREIDENLKNVVYHEIPFPNGNFIKDRKILENYLESLKNGKIV
jgi:glycosyltransferase involved in cell wall biosynthesis